MSKPIIFDDFSKAAKDLMKDDFCTENKLTFKTKAGKSNLTYEAKGTSEVVSKIQLAVQPVEKVNIKKLSVDSRSVLVSEVDLVNILKNTTFTYRGESNLKERQFNKNEVGLKFLNDKLAIEAAYDLHNANYKTSSVVGTQYGLFGIKAFGNTKAEKMLTSVDLGMRRQCEKCTISLQSQNMFQRANLTLLTSPYDNIRIASSIDLPLRQKNAPIIDFGVHIVPYEGQEYRIKVDSKGMISGVWKVNVENKLTFSTTVQMEGKDLTAGKHTLAAAVEFKF